VTQLQDTQVIKMVRHDATPRLKNCRLFNLLELHRYRPQTFSKYAAIDIYITRRSYSLHCWYRLTIFAELKKRTPCRSQI